MDCPSEEVQIRGVLSGIAGIKLLEFDIPAKSLTVYHEIEAETVINKINELSLDAQLVSSAQYTGAVVVPGTDEAQRRTLIILLAINAAMFFAEVAAGIIFDSMGLFGDGLDMLADASVYSLALYAVGRAQSAKNRVTLFSGLAQLTLAVVLFAQVIGKFIYGSDPVSVAMITVSCAALLANAYCLYLITPHRHGETHMKASWIFSANDVLVNAGIIMAGILVYLLKSNLPDLIIGFFIAVAVTLGSVRIIRLARN